MREFAAEDRREPHDRVRVCRHGTGIPLFGALPHDVRLQHVATRHYASGLVQSDYRIETEESGGRHVVPLEPDVR